MRAILISINPKWATKILNGEKTIEIRKTMPKCDLPIDVYIYCTKQNARYYIENKIYNSMMNGKVVAKFTLNKVEEIINYGLARRSEIMMKELLEKSCLTMRELNEYAPHKEYDDNDYIYAWHISNLVIFDKPKELGEFKHYNKPHCDSCPFQYSALCDYHREVECDDIPLTKAPQSFQFIEVKE